VGGFKKGNADGFAIAFETMSKGVERSMLVHPLAQSRYDSFACFVTVQNL